MDLRSISKKTIIVGFWILLWQIISHIVDNELLLPGPLDTAGGLFSLLVDTQFYADIASTVSRCLIAIALSLAIGAILALISYRVGFVRDILSLPVAFLKSVPIMAVAIYMIFLLSSGNVPVLVCFILCFPIVYTNLLQGLDSMDRIYLEMSIVYGLDTGKVIRYIYIPQLYPYFKSAVSLIAGMSWKAIVTAEVLSIPKFSLGYELMNAKYYLRTELLFAYVLTIVALSVSFEKLVKHILEKHDFKPYTGSRIKSGKARKSDFGVPGNAACSGAPDIVFDCINKSYGEKIVLKDFTALIEGGKTTALMAPSGAGKTTLMRLMTGLEKSDSGNISYQIGGAVNDIHVRLAVLFQEDRLLPWLNVYDNLAIVKGRDAGDDIITMLGSVGMSDEIYHMPDQLSGGMSHRVSMIRMFLYGGDIIVADEPFRGLDDATRDQVVDNLWIPNVANKTVMLITHDRELAERLATKIVLL